ncbi:hypothetical protein OIU79_008134 [Salix purpurea]|uniref:Uncharacterized protein n=1 Tax=Salix purpurea TaxID=77065 RepID=A0A9Q0THN8_SALPP|nr:hypothetical protein OIU79_008134 [Salix purpurea]
MNQIGSEKKVRRTSRE